MIIPKDPPVYIGPERGQFIVFQDRHGRVAVTAGRVVVGMVSPPVVVTAPAAWTGRKIDQDGTAWLAIETNSSGVVIGATTGANDSLPAEEVTGGGGARYYLPLAYIEGRVIYPVLAGGSAVQFVVPTGTTAIP